MILKCRQHLGLDLLDVGSQNQLVLSLTQILGLEYCEVLLHYLVLNLDETELPHSEFSLIVMQVLHPLSQVLSFGQRLSDLGHLLGIFCPGVIELHILLKTLLKREFKEFEGIEHNHVSLCLFLKLHFPCYSVKELSHSCLIKRVCKQFDAHSYLQLAPPLLKVPLSAYGSNSLSHEVVSLLLLSTVVHVHLERVEGFGQSFD